MVESEDVKKAEIDRLYKENVSKVYRTALYYVEDHYVAEEIVQEVPYSSEGLDAQLIEVLRQKECRELHDTIFADLYEKNSRWYEAVTVSYTLDKPQKEVAEKMGISVDTLYSTLYRAKQWIKKYYEEQFHQLDGK